MQARKTNGPQARAGCIGSAQTRQAHRTNLERQSQRLVPANVAAERSVLGALIEDDGLIPSVLDSGLKPEHFLVSDHRRVMSRVLEMHTRKTPIDYLAVAEALGNRQEDYVLVASLIDGVVAEVDHILHHAEIVRRKWQLRRVLKIAEWLLNAADDAADPEALIADAVVRLENASAPEVRA